MFSLNSRICRNQYFHRHFLAQKQALPNPISSYFLFTLISLFPLRFDKFSNNVINSLGRNNDNLQNNNLLSCKVMKKIYLEVVFFFFFYSKIISLNCTQIFIYTCVKHTHICGRYGYRHMYRLNTHNYMSLI